MDDLFKRFKDDKLSAGELKAFREDVAKMSDSSIDEALSCISAQWSFDSTEIDALREWVQRDIENDMKHRRGNKILLWSAAVMVPVLIAVSLYAFVRGDVAVGDDALMAKEIVVKTGAGQRAVTMLPDGSKVTLGPQSAVSYRLEAFAGSGRRVSWSGDGRFEIAHDENVPFFLVSEFYEVKVLGTVFSTMLLDDGAISEIYLEEGSIELKSVKDESVTALRPGDTAVLDNSSGHVEVYGGNSGYRHSSSDGMLYFKLRSFSEVTRALERNYGVKFYIEPSIAGMTFTGALPADDLSMALVVLEKAFSVRITYAGDGMKVMPL